MRAWMAGVRRILGILVLLGIPAVLSTACTRSSPAAAQRGTAVVVFIDFSDSVTGSDRTAFKRELEAKVLPWLDAGDKILIAPIHDKTMTDFRPLVDVTLPPRPQFNGWLNNVMKYNKESKEADAQLTQTKKSLRTQAGEALNQKYVARYTDIFSSLLMTQKLFGDEARHKVLILMSDMIEDYPPYAFDRMQWTPTTTQKMLAELQAKQLIADLTDVCVYASGVSAPSAELAQQIGRFWEEYFKRANADLHPSRYARVLLHWPPPTSCRRF
jgi:hypothetical protein